MKMSSYARRTEAETRVNCINAMEGLKEQIRVATDAYNLSMSELRARIKTCEETIDRIDRELLADSVAGSLAEGR